MMVLRPAEGITNIHLQLLKLMKCYNAASKKPGIRNEPSRPLSLSSSARTGRLRALEPQKMTCYIEMKIIGTG